MTKSVIKICNFVHYFFREGGYLYCDQFSLLLFSLFMVGGGVQREIVPNSLYPLFFFLNASLTNLIIYTLFTRCYHIFIQEQKHAHSSRVINITILLESFNIECNNFSVLCACLIDIPIFSREIFLYAVASLALWHDCQSQSNICKNLWKSPMKKSNEDINENINGRFIDKIMDIVMDILIYKCLKYVDIKHLHCQNIYISEWGWYLNICINWIFKYLHLIDMIYHLDI